VQMVMVPDAAPVFSFLSSWPVGAASYFSAAIVSSLLASLVLATHTVPTRPALVAGGGRVQVLSTQCANTSSVGCRGGCWFLPHSVQKSIAGSRRVSCILNWKVWRSRLIGPTSLTGPSFVCRGYIKDVCGAWCRSGFLFLIYLCGECFSLPAYVFFAFQCRRPVNR